MGKLTEISNRANFKMVSREKVMEKRKAKKIIEKLPRLPGCYLFKNRAGEVLYVGKALSLRDRVRSYFSGPTDRPNIRPLVKEIFEIETVTTDSEIEAVLLEPDLIKKFRPRFNIRQRDDKSFLMIEIENYRIEKSVSRVSRQPVGHQLYPRIHLIRLNDYRKKKKTKKTKGNLYFGPYPSSYSLKRAMRQLRKIFPFRDCAPSKFDRYQRLGRGCLYHSLNLCPAPCVPAIDQKDYRTVLGQLIRFIRGEKKRLVKDLELLMKNEAAKKNFEKAVIVRDQLYGLRHIHQVAGLRREDLNRIRDEVKEGPRRIEAYDISNIQGQFSVGSMVVFEQGIPKKSDYRRFRIKTVSGANDTAALAEVVARRLGHPEWPLPDLFLIDGGLGQLLAVGRVIEDRKINRPILAIAKGRSRKRLDRRWRGEESFLSDNLLCHARDEAHRFAVSYYRKLHLKSQDQ